MTATEEIPDLITSTAQDLIADLLKRMPPETTLGEFADEILLLEALREGTNSLRAGKGIPHEEVMREFAPWLGK